MVAPTPVYRQRLEQRGRRAAARLQAVGDGELPDANLTDARRRSLRKHACALRARLSSHELMYLASALEVEANGK